MWFHYVSLLMDQPVYANLVYRTHDVIKFYYFTKFIRIIWNIPCFLFLALLEHNTIDLALYIFALKEIYTSD